jgi:hypothetical protein
LFPVTSIDLGQAQESTATLTAPRLIGYHLGEPMTSTNPMQRFYQDKAEGWLDSQEAGTPSAGDTAARTAGNIAWIVFLVIINVATLGYFVPWWVAVHRRVPDYGAVIVINILLGWTIVGWVVAMAMACRTVPQSRP